MTPTDNVLLIIDAQNDFLTDEDADKLSANIQKIIQMYNKIYFTKLRNYSLLDVYSNKQLDPVEGSNIIKRLSKYAKPENTILKPVYRFLEYGLVFMHDKVVPKTITLAGAYTDKNVLTNGIILKILYPNADIKVLKNCCIGTTKEQHELALNILKTNEIEPI